MALWLFLLRELKDHLAQVEIQRILLKIKIDRIFLY